MERACDALAATGIDLAIIAAPATICYITGFDVPAPYDAGWEFSEGQPLLLLAVASGHTILLCPDGWTVQAQRSAPRAELRLFPRPGAGGPSDGVTVFLDAIRAALRELGAGPGTTLGIEPRYLSERASALVRDEFGAARRQDMSDALYQARRIKTAREIALIEVAVAAADAGQEELTRLCRADAVGLSEVELYARVQVAIHRAAGGPVPVVGELVSGPRVGVVQYPGGPTTRRVERGDTIIQDISMRVGGYWSDCTNTLVAGAEPTPDQRRYFRAARHAFEACVERLRPGNTAADAVAAAQRAFAAEGFNVTPYCGHQIGAAVNERPRLLHSDHTPIEAGMVFAVEPGVYGGEGTGLGARAERVIVVGQDGPRILSTFAWGIATEGT